MKVYFSHGKESGPWGYKIKRLANIAKEHGCSVESIDYTDTLDPDIRVERLIRILNEAEDSDNTEEDYLLVGSSMGGYVSLVASETVNAKALFLLAPALYMPGYDNHNCSNTSTIEIVHGWSDDVIPPENSIKFAKNIDCTLHLISGDHPLNTSIELVEILFTQFLTSQIHNKD